MGGNLIVALVAAAAEEARESRFSKALASEHFDAQGEFHSRLLAAIRAHGYQVVEVPAAPDRSKYLDAYPALPAAPDAWLDCLVPVWGYAAANTLDDTPYRPLLSMSCRLVRAGNGEILLRDTVSYNPLRVQPGAIGSVAIAPDPQFAFKTGDLLIADPRRAIEGLRISFDRSTEALGTLLK